MHKFLPILIYCVVGCCSGLVQAAPVGAASGGEACIGDYQKFCAKEPSGSRRAARCLMQHRHEVSPDCQHYLQTVQKQAKAFREACQHDLKQFCSGTKPGNGGMLTCLQQHHDTLSASCRQFLDH